MLGGIIGAGIGAVGNLIGGAINAKTQKQIAAKNREMQYDFAKNQIGWKVADLQKAGLSPQLAVGMSGQQASPSYAGDVDNGISSAMSDIGNAVGSSIDQHFAKIANKQSAELSLKRQQLENERLQADINRIKTDTGIKAVSSIDPLQGHQVAPLGIGGQGTNLPRAANAEKAGMFGFAKPQPYYTMYQMPDGSVKRMLAPDVADVVESSYAGSAMQAIRDFVDHYIFPERTAKNISLRHGVKVINTGGNHYETLQNARKHGRVSPHRLPMVNRFN